LLTSTAIVVGLHEVSVLCGASDQYK